MYGDISLKHEGALQLIIYNHSLYYLSAICSCHADESVRTNK